MRDRMRTEALVATVLALFTIAGCGSASYRAPTAAHTGRPHAWPAPCSVFTGAVGKQLEPDGRSLGRGRTPQICLFGRPAKKELLAFVILQRGSLNELVAELTPVKPVRIRRLGDDAVCFTNARPIRGLYGAGVAVQRGTGLFSLTGTSLSYLGCARLEAVAREINSQIH
jgi:hypothetical protein